MNGTGSVPFDQLDAVWSQGIVNGIDKEKKPQVDMDPVAACTNAAAHMDVFLGRI